MILSKKLLDRVWPYCLKMVPGGWWNWYRSYHCKRKEAVNITFACLLAYFI